MVLLLTIISGFHKRCWKQPSIEQQERQQAEHARVKTAADVYAARIAAAKSERLQQSRARWGVERLLGDDEYIDSGFAADEGFDEPAGSNHARPSQVCDGVDAGQRQADLELRFQDYVTLGVQQRIMQAGQLAAMQREDVEARVRMVQQRIIDRSDSPVYPGCSCNSKAEIISKRPVVLHIIGGCAAVDVPTYRCVCGVAGGAGLWSLLPFNSFQSR